MLDIWYKTQYTLLLTLMFQRKHHGKPQHEKQTKLLAISATAPELETVKRLEKLEKLPGIIQKFATIVQDDRRTISELMAQVSHLKLQVASISHPHSITSEFEHVDSATVVAPDTMDMFRDNNLTDVMNDLNETNMFVTMLDSSDTKSESKEGNDSKMTSARESHADEDTDAGGDPLVDDGDNINDNNNNNDNNSEIHRIVSRTDVKKSKRPGKKSKKKKKKKGDSSSSDEEAK